MARFGGVAGGHIGGMRRPLGVADRVFLGWTAWAFAALAAVVLVSAVGGAIVWWNAAGSEGVAGGERAWPAIALVVLGTAAAGAFYGLSRVCRVVTRLCTDADPRVVAARARRVAMSNTPSVPRPVPSPRPDPVAGSRHVVGQA